MGAARGNSELSVSAEDTVRRMGTSWVLRKGVLDFFFKQTFIWYLFCSRHCASYLGGNNENEMRFFALF